MDENNDREIVTGAVVGAAAAEVVVSRLAQIGAAGGGVCIIVQSGPRESDTSENEPILSLTANVAAVHAEAARAAFNDREGGEQ